MKFHNNKQRTVQGFLAGLALTITLLLSTLPPIALASDLDGHLWRHRLLFLIAPDVNDPAVEHQLLTLNHRSEALFDRELRVYQLYQSGGSFFQDQPISADLVERLRDRLRVKPGSKMLVLIGKDGTIKRRAPLDSDIRDIFLLIDEMPMRRTEIQEKLDSGQRVTVP